MPRSKFSRSRASTGCWAQCLSTAPADHARSCRLLFMLIFFIMHAAAVAAYGTCVVRRLTTDQAHPAVGLPLHQSTFAVPPSQWSALALARSAFEAPDIKFSNVTGPLDVQFGRSASTMTGRMTAPDPALAAALGLSNFQVAVDPTGISRLHAADPRHWREAVPKWLRSADLAFVPGASARATILRNLFAWRWAAKTLRLVVRICGGLMHRRLRHLFFGRRKPSTPVRTIDTYAHIPGGCCGSRGCTLILLALCLPCAGARQLDCSASSWGVLR